MKKRYVKPKVQTHGKLKSITKGGSGGGEDEGYTMPPS